MSKKARRQVEPKREERCESLESPWRRMLDADERVNVARKIDWALFAIACLGILWLHIVLYEHAGAFWRDEASTLHVATRPDVATMWKWLSKDSAPVLSYAALRAWIASGIGVDDDGLRAFGTLISVGIVASLFFSCRSLTGRVPLLALALVAFNANVFYHASSLRAYGMAVLFIMPCFAAFARMIRGPTKGNVLASLLFGLLSCHASYQNSYLLFAIGAAGAVACAMCRLWRRAALVLAVCFAVAVSMFVYIPAISAYQNGSNIQTYALTLQSIVQSLAEAFSGGSTSLLCAWIFLATAAIAVLVFRATRRRESTPEAGTPSPVVYGLVAAITAGTVVVGFIRIHGFLPHPWHFVPLIAFFAVVVEVAFQSRRNKAWVWWARVGTALVVILLSLPDVWRASLTRRTTLDCVSSVLAENASPDDLILVNPFWLSPGFKYYYHGKAEWNTIPLSSSELEVSASPFAAIKQLMATRDSIEPTLRKITATLASGHRVWIVGHVKFRPLDDIPANPPPAPHARTGWNCNIYLKAWNQRVCRCIQDHARTIRLIPVETPQPVSECEDEPLTLVEGWKGD
jgi:hypothetical protein